MHLDDRLPSKQARGLRRAQRESSKLLEHASVDGKILLGFQANAPAGAAHVNDSKPGRLRELEDGQRADGGCRMRTAAERQAAVFHHRERAVLAPSRIPTRIPSCPSCEGI